MNPRAKSVKYLDGYKLIITFENNEIKQFDLQPYLHFNVYRPLQDETFCKKVMVRDGDGVLYWSDFIDIDPDRAYMESISV